MKKKYFNQKELDVIIDKYIDFKAKKIASGIKECSVPKNKKISYV